MAFTQNQREEARDLSGVAGSLHAETGTHQQTYVAYGIDQQGGKGGANFAEEKAPPVLSDSHGTPHAVAFGVCSDGSNSMKSGNPHSGIYKADVVKTLDLAGGAPTCKQGGTAIVSAVDARNGRETPVNGTLQAKTTGGGRA